MDSGDTNKLCDMGLRYDLTLPLSRYYANNREQLVLPAKCIQIDKVYIVMNEGEIKGEKLVQDATQENIMRLLI